MEANVKWDITELEEFFKSTPIPDGPIILGPGETIINTHKFIDSHLAVIRRKNGIPTFRPYFDRLVKLKEILLKS